MKSVIVGNGINIQFGGKAYASEFIMKRIKYRTKLGYYDILFDGVLGRQEIIRILNIFVIIANDILDNKYDDCLNYNCVNYDELLPILNDFKDRYNKIKTPHQLMLEDWFFVLHMYFLKNSDISDNLIASKQGFERLILDGIYNGGKLQEVYKKMPKKVKKFFLGFDNIFTLNYDNNLEDLTGKNVYHLHGDFSVLSNSENPENVLGFIRKKTNNRVIIEGMEHCFCNALLNYSGHLKLKEANTNHNLIVCSEKFKWKYDNDEAFKSYLLSLKDSKPVEHEMYMTKINNENLNMATEYYFFEFDNIEGELHIIGMSPNNDGHIFECINNNKKLRKVYIYCFSKSEKDYIEENLPKDLYIAKNVNDLWKSLNCVNKKYNIKYNLPDDIDRYIDCFNSLSDDTVSKDDAIAEISKIPKFEAIRLCKLVKEDLIKRNPNHTSINKSEFEETSASVSHIALTEGILPTALYMLYVIHYDEVKGI